MSRPTIGRRKALAMLGATALTGCAAPAVVSRNNEDPFEGGIGGTGIVGILSDFGSVIVNGIRVETTDQTRIFLGNQRVSESDLTVGGALNVFARKRGDRLEAVRIDMDDPLVGTLRADGDGLTVNGTRIHGALHHALVGQTVSIGGVWRGTNVQAASITARSGPDSVAGTLLRDGNTARIGTTPLALRPGLILPADGSYVVANGAFINGRLEVTNLRTGRFSPALGALRLLSVDGYLENSRTAPGLRLSGLGHSFDRRLNLSPFTSARAVYFGRYTGDFLAARAVTIPDDFASLRPLLRPDETFADALTQRAVPIIATN